jgi:hypothetical protein
MHCGKTGKKVSLKPIVLVTATMDIQQKKLGPSKASKKVEIK